MAEISSQQGPDSNPITDSKLLLHHHGNGQLPLITNGHPNGHHGNNVPATGQPTLTNHPVNGVPNDGGHSDHSDGDTSSSPSSEEEGEEEEESSSEEEELSEQMQLKNAGVELDLEALGTPTEGGVAPLHLLSEFVSCCVRNEHGAALILCKKVLEFEPQNQTATDFLPVLEERLKLDEELSTESSSEGESDSSTADSQTTNHCVATTTHSHSC